MRYLLISIFLIGCSTATARHPTTDTKGLTRSWSTEQCQSLLDQMDALSWGLAFATGLTGVGGLSTAFPDNSDTRLGLGISSAVLAAGASSIAVLLQNKRKHFSTYCNVEEELATEEDPIPDKTTPTVITLIDVYPSDGGVE